MHAAYLDLFPGCATALPVLNPPMLLKEDDDHD
jgi:hypothetical protein